MVTTSVHGRAINAAARRALAPLGLTRRGRSRVWLDDRGWWLLLVEFQPSSWARGTYLNVGAMWLWQSTDHLSFDVGYRVEAFRELTDEASVEAAADAVATRAAREVLRYRVRFPDVRAVAHELSPKLSSGGWDGVHAAIAAGLAGQRELAEAALRDIAVPDADDFPWLRELRGWAGKLAGLVGRPSKFARGLTEIIHTTRTALRLPPWSGELVHTDRDPAA